MLFIPRWGKIRNVEYGGYFSAASIDNETRENDGFVIK